MRKRRRFLLIVLPVVGIFVSLALLKGDKEPTYQGRSLSEWFAVYSTNLQQEEPESKRKAADAKQAIRNIGTNALPILLKRIQYQSSKSRIGFLRFVDKLPSMIWNNRLVLPFLKDKGALAAENA